MKKVLSAVLAATMALSMAATSFAAVTNLGPTGKTVNDGYLVNLTAGAGDVIGDTFELTDEWLWNYKDESVKFYVITDKDSDLRADVDAGDVKVSDKRVIKDASLREVGDYFNIDAWKVDTDEIYNVYEVKVTSDAPVRTFKKLDWSIELDYDDESTFIKGHNGYSAIREVESGERYTIKETKGNTTEMYDDNGSIFEFNRALDSEVRINAHDYVDLFFKGNYGTDIENLRVSTDKISEIEDYFDDIDIDYYDFIGTPKFASDVKVRIDADPNAYIYEYNKATGDLTDITDLCDYESNGYTFTTTKLLTYVVAEEAYEGGNVNEEEEDKDEVEEVEDNTDKENPGTGAF